MSKSLNAYELACRINNRFSVPVFPVRLLGGANESIQKQPLVKWSLVDGEPQSVSWQGANAVGVPMGKRSGLIAIDLDDYKSDAETENWLFRHSVPRTRTHKTASGGRHLIFKQPNNVVLSNRAPNFRGLDIRSDGGFIVWADTVGLYQTIDSSSPADLPLSILRELKAINQARKNDRLCDSDLPVLQHVCQTSLCLKLEHALNNVADLGLKSRFAGSTNELTDISRSGMDMSIAGMLARRGFTFSEIAITLMFHFNFGTAARDGETPRVWRGAMRCAARATREVMVQSNAKKRIIEKSLRGAIGQKLGGLDIGIQ
ncbi:bifunctional DNA primase/polymerase [Cognatishimia sp. D5M38]|uniref:Bifunctional DNA primase/polymerase n=1 Tax=Cognatishimia coralii TaxID=3083254 RepID=A0ABU8QHG6_9RHOB